jgi:hypothetical protein
VREGTFFLDVVSLLPLDILYIWLGTGNHHSINIMEIIERMTKCRLYIIFRIL